MPQHILQGEEAFYSILLLLFNYWLHYLNKI